MKREQLTSLIEAWLDHTISEFDLTRLKQELLTNPESVEFYIELAEMHSLLSQAKTISLPQTNVVPTELVLKRQKHKNLKWALFSAAAILVIALVTMRLFFIDTAQAPPLAFETAPGTQFTISHDHAEEVSTGQIMTKGSRIQISQGTVELTFRSGVKSIIMGPADLTLHDDDLLYMNQGSGWFRVPQKAVGFKVKTKDLNIVDLGTEFGVLANPNDHDEVHVIKGKVQVTANRIRKESTILTANQARRIDPVGRLITIPAKNRMFASTLPNTLPYIHWSFDQNHGIQPSGPHPVVSQITTSGKANFVTGRRGKALTVNQKNGFIQTDWEGFLGQHPRSVSLWFRVRASELQDKDIASLVHWGNAKSNNNKWKIGILNATVPKATVIRLSFGNDWFNTSCDVADGQWHHCLVVYRGPMVQRELGNFDVYIDGTPQQLHRFGKISHPHIPLQKKSKIYTLEGSRLSIGGDDTSSTTTTFPGDIDEVTIFDGVLPEHQIPSLMDGSLIPSH